MDGDAGDDRVPYPPHLIGAGNAQRETAQWRLDHDWPWRICPHCEGTGKVNT